MNARSFAFAALAALALTACQKAPPKQTTPAADGNAELATRVDDLDKRLAKIEALLGEALAEQKEPDPAAVYSVAVDGDPYEGAADAKVTVVKAFEFACGFCYRARPTVQQILDTYKGDVKVVYKYFVVHEQAVGPGLAVCAAHKQGKFHEMKGLIWDKGFAEQDIGREKMQALAEELGLDMTRFAEDMASEGCMSWLRDGYRSLSDLGVRGTPAFYVNGRFVSGAQPFAIFKALIDQELAKANEAISGGTSVADYYQSHIVAKGRKEL